MGDPLPYEAQRLIWIDLETTGLDPEKDQILEIACVVTDERLIIQEQIVRVIAPIDPITLNPFVLKMHVKNGLLAACADSTHTIDHAAYAVGDFLRDQGIEIGRGLIAGSTPQFDKAFLARHMPYVHRYFNHRVFDVSTIKASMRMWYDPESYKGSETAHRALADIEHSIHVAGMYRIQLQWAKRQWDQASVLSLKGEGPPVP